MHPDQWMSSRIRRITVVALLIAASGATIAFADRGGDRRAGAPAKPKIEATIFSFDGQDFVRTMSTLMTEDGKSAVDTKLDRNTPAFQALMQKHSFSGDANVFGKAYAANYAPLTGSDGRLTGALFVAVAK